MPTSNPIYSIFRNILPSYKAIAFLFVLLPLTYSTTHADDRNLITINGSTTVHPLAKAFADHYSEP